MSKGMMWILVIVAFVVGGLVGFYFERTRAISTLNSTKMVLQKEIDDAKMMAEASPTGAMMHDLTMMAKSGDLTDVKGMTLYTYDKDTSGKSNCSGTCATTWPPYLTVGSTSSSMPEHLGTIKRSDGSEQYTWDGKPLYYYIGDKKAGDVNGDGVGGVWHVVK